MEIHFWKQWLMSNSFLLWFQLSKSHFKNMNIAIAWFFRDFLDRLPLVNNGQLIKLTSMTSFSLTLSWRRFLSYRNHSIDLQCKSMNWFLHDKHICQEELIFLLNYLVQRTSSCKLPWHLWHCVQSLLNFSSKACRVLISFWNNSLSLGLQCWQTTEFSGMKNNNVLGITNCLVRETDNINSLNSSKLPSYRNK